MDFLVGLRKEQEDRSNDEHRREEKNHDDIDHV